MNDSKELNEKKEGIVDTTPKGEEQTSTPKVDNNSEDIKEISGEIVSVILNKEVSVKFDDKEEEVNPYQLDSENNEQNNNGKSDNKQNNFSINDFEE